MEEERRGGFRGTPSTSLKLNVFVLCLSASQQKGRSDTRRYGLPNQDFLSSWMRFICFGFHSVRQMRPPRCTVLLTVSHPLEAARPQHRVVNRHVAYHALLTTRLAPLYLLASHHSRRDFQNKLVLVLLWRGDGSRSPVSPGSLAPHRAVISLRR